MHFASGPVEGWDPLAATLATAVRWGRKMPSGTAVGGARVHALRADDRVGKAVPSFAAFALVRLGRGHIREAGWPGPASIRQFVRL